MAGAAVAWSAGRGYAARVSRLHFHRWAVIFLLVSKLILGELAHSMPHVAEPASAMTEMVTSSSQDSAPCGSHVQHGSESDDHAAKSCCEGGECACPCLHSPAATETVLVAMSRAHDHGAVLVEGVAWQRLFGLFRPPA